MEYLPISLKTAHLGVAGLGLYASIEGQDKIDPSTGTTETISADNGFEKSTYLSAVYIVTVVALLQFAVLMYYHNYGGKESHFKVAYFGLALVNIIFSSIVIQQASTALHVTNGSTRTKPTGDAYDALLAGVVLGGVVLFANFVNMYHAGYAGVRNGGMRRSPRRK